METIPLFGLHTALVTPFRADGAMDEGAFRRLCAWQVSCGVTGIVIGAAEGEGSSLTDDERGRLVELAAIESGNEAIVMGAVLANGTVEACRQAALLRGAGAQAILLAAPCYNKPTMDGVISHVDAVAAVGLPVIIANAPQRSAIDLGPSTIRDLASIANVVGVLDATRDLVRPVTTRLSVPSSFAQLCGADDLMTAFNLNGGVGAISAASNLVPKSCVWLQEACRASDWRAAQRLQAELSRLVGTIPAFGAPAALKRGLTEARLLPGATVRLPEVAAQVPDAPHALRRTVRRRG